ncbi:hypothetical protein NYF23_08260 [SAR92 clade bacterium H455]|uniref:DUF4390 domain-containing protein n=1 Tax=SAR92 clade bacterium H455 TaxID=2974818 RepID=A0ABY5TJN8_9GAMM|nr:hypothetical protein NYF23_08260 [SAR92 clade bacterium H455]
MASNPLMLVLKRCLLLVAITAVISAEGHGLSSASAKIEVRPSRLVELSVQFDFIKLLNHGANAYPLAVVASLPEQKFALLYKEVIKLFDNELKVMVGNKAVVLNKRYPTEQQMLSLLKGQLVDAQFSSQGSMPYTYSDRRFFQVLSFDFKLITAQQLSDMQVTFPKELGDIYITYSKSKSSNLHPGESWQPN